MTDLFRFFFSLDVSDRLSNTPTFSRELARNKCCVASFDCLLRVLPKFSECDKLPCCKNTTFFLLFAKWSFSERGGSTTHNKQLQQSIARHHQGRQILWTFSNIRRTNLDDIFVRNSVCPVFTPRWFGHPKSCLTVAHLLTIVKLPIVTFEFL